MTDRPIIFSAPMIKALLAGRKTQTRRIIKLPTKGEYVRPDMGGWEPSTIGGGGYFTFGPKGQREPVPEEPCIWNQTTGTTICMRYSVGDRLYVRETWSHTGIGVWSISDTAHARDGGPIYRATDTQHTGPWWPSIHMPRRYSRLTLLVTDVRLQRLQGISEDDCFAEGIETDLWDMAPVARRYGHDDAWFVGWPMGVSEPNISVEAEEVGRRSFASLWQSIHGADAWAENPWICAVSFSVQHGNIDAMKVGA